MYQTWRQKHLDEHRRWGSPQPALRLSDIPLPVHATATSSPGRQYLHFPLWYASAKLTKYRYEVITIVIMCNSYSRVPYRSKRGRVSPLRICNMSTSIKRLLTQSIQQYGGMSCSHLFLHDNLTIFCVRNFNNDFGIRMC